MKTLIPWTMVSVRALMGPGIALLALHGASGLTLATVVLLMLLDDIADGMVARRFGTDTPGLRLSDSLADTVFYLGVAAAIWIRTPQAIRSNGPALAVLFALEALRYVYDLRKYGKAASYHSYLAKAWGLVLAAAIVWTLLQPAAVLPVRIAAAFGIVVNLEGLAMSLLLPRWQNDVRTLAAAVRLRRSMLASADSAPPRC